MRKHLGIIAKAALGLLVLASATEAVAKNVVSHQTYVLPGIDSSGNLDSSLGAESSGRLTYNTKNGRLVVVARGHVTNDSHVKQTYSDLGVITDGTVIKDDYRVCAKGHAVYRAVAKGATQPTVSTDPIVIGGSTDTE